MNRRLGTVAVFLLSVVCGGCGSGSPGPRAAVHGAVTLDGKPLKAGVVQFHCCEGDQLMVAQAFVENGKYEIDAEKGPVAGLARVQFHPKPLSEEEFEAALGASHGRRKPKLVVAEIPERYGAESTLTAEVAESGDNQFDFELTSRR